MKVETVEDFVAQFDTKVAAAKSLGVRPPQHIYRYLKMGDRAIVVDGKLFIRQGNRK